jgi:hypothetical protein
MVRFGEQEMVGAGEEQHRDALGIRRHRHQVQHPRFARHTRGDASVQRGAHLERSGEVCESSREFVHESTIREGPPTELKPDGNETRKWGRFLGEWKR